MIWEENKCNSNLVLSDKGFNSFISCEKICLWSQYNHKNEIWFLKNIFISCWYNVLIIKDFSVSFSRVHHWIDYTMAQATIRRFCSSKQLERCWSHLFNRNYNTRKHQGWENMKVTFYTNFVIVNKLFCI